MYAYPRRRVDQQTSTFSDQACAAGVEPARNRPRREKAVVPSFVHFRRARTVVTPFHLHASRPPRHPSRTDRPFTGRPRTSPHRRRETRRRRRANQRRSRSRRRDVRSARRPPGPLVRSVRPPHRLPRLPPTARLPLFLSNVPFERRVRRPRPRSSPAPLPRSRRVRRFRRRRRRIPPRGRRRFGCRLRGRAHNLVRHLGRCVGLILVLVHLVHPHPRIVRRGRRADAQSSAAAVSDARGAKRSAPRSIIGTPLGTNASMCRRRASRVVTRASSAAAASLASTSSARGGGGGEGAVRRLAKTFAFRRAENHRRFHRRSRRCLHLRANVHGRLENVRRARGTRRGKRSRRRRREGRRRRWRRRRRRIPGRRIPGRRARRGGGLGFSSIPSRHPSRHLLLGPTRPEAAGGLLVRRPIRPATRSFAGSGEVRRVTPRVSSNRQRRLRRRTVGGAGMVAVVGG